MWGTWNILYSFRFDVSDQVNAGKNVQGTMAKKYEDPVDRILDAYIAYKDVQSKNACYWQPKSSWPHKYYDSSHKGSTGLETNVSSVSYPSSIVKPKENNGNAAASPPPPSLKIRERIAAHPCEPGTRAVGARRRRQ